MSKKIYVAEVPVVSKAYAKDLAARFRPIEIKPGITHDEIMFNAGMQRVIQYVLQTSSYREVTGNPDKLKQDMPPSVLERLFGFLPKVR